MQWAVRSVSIVFLKFSFVMMMGELVFPGLIACCVMQGIGPQGGGCHDSAMVSALTSTHKMMKQRQTV